MSDLSELKCEACHIGAVAVDEADFPNFLNKLEDWQVIKRDGVNQLERVFKFKNFKQALAFTNLIGKLAEEEFHHPGLLTEWGKVTVTWWSHSIKGLHKNDFIMAAKTDALFEQ